LCFACLVLCSLCGNLSNGLFPSHMCATLALVLACAVALAAPTSAAITFPGYIVTAECGTAGVLACSRVLTVFQSQMAVR
jgi:hypothetical protein